MNNWEIRRKLSPFNWKIKAVFFLLVVIAGLLLMYINNKQDETKESTADSDVVVDSDADISSYAYDVQTVNLAGDDVEGYAYIYLEDEIIGYKSEYPIDEITGELKLEMTVGYYDYDGNPGDTYVYTRPSDDTLTCFAADSNHNLVFVDMSCGFTEDASEYGCSYSLNCLSRTGEEVYSYNISDVDADFCINNVSVGTDDKVYISSNEGIFVYADNKMTSVIESKDGDNPGEVYACPDGSLLGIVYGDEKTLFRVVDPVKGTVKDEYEMPINVCTYFITSMKADGKLLLAGADGVYECNYIDGELHKVFDYVDSDLTICGSVYGSYIRDDGTVLFSYYDNGKVGTLSAIAKPRTDAYAGEVITLGTCSANYELVSEVVGFNTSQNDVRIDIVDYTTVGRDSNPEDALRMTQALMSNQAPDIIELSKYTTPYMCYMGSGLLANLNPYIDGDSTINRDDLSANVLEAGSLGDNLYMIVPYYSISTVVGKESVFGDKSGITYEELAGLMSDKGLATFNSLTNQMALEYALELTIADYIDWNAMTCDFDNERFEQLLEFATSFDDEIVYDERYASVLNGFALPYRNDEVAMVEMLFDSYKQWGIYEQGVFGENIVPVGFPAYNCNGSAIDFYNGYAISASSDNADAAWAFISRLLSEESQKNIVYGFPIRKECLAAAARKAMDGETQYDEDGNVIDAHETYTVGDDEVVISKPTAEEIARYDKYMARITSIACNDASIHDIVEEEATKYFSGDCTSKEVACNINRRVTDYLSGYCK